MSVWTTVEGSIKIQLSDHFSIRKSIEEMNWEYTIGNIQEIHRDIPGIKEYYILFEFCDEGLSAAEAVREWLDNFPKSSIVELSSSIRCLA